MTFKPEHISVNALKNIRKLTQKKYRQLANSFIIEGKKIVEEALKSNWEIETIVATKEFINNGANQRLIVSIKRTQVHFFEIASKELDTITDTESAQGIAAIVKMKFPDINKAKLFEKESETLVILDRVTDPGNFGTIIRTCDWFGTDALILSKNSIELYNPKVVRSTMGAIFHLPIFVDVELENFLSKIKNHQFKIITTVLEGESVASVSFPKKVAFVFGSESHGISKSMSDASNIKLTIPKFGEIESLNVSVACGIVLAFRTLIR
jgi:RNA methyltransferase, TrmH family